MPADGSRLGAQGLGEFVGSRWTPCRSCKRLGQSIPLLHEFVRLDVEGRAARRLAVNHAADPRTMLGLHGQHQAMIPDGDHVVLEGLSDIRRVAASLDPAPDVCLQPNGRDPDARELGTRGVEHLALDVDRTLEPLSQLREVHEPFATATQLGQIRSTSEVTPQDSRALQELPGVAELRGLQHPRELTISGDQPYDVGQSLQPEREALSEQDPDLIRLCVESFDRRRIRAGGQLEDALPSRSRTSELRQDLEDLAILESLATRVDRLLQSLATIPQRREARLRSGRSDRAARRPVDCGAASSLGLTSTPLRRGRAFCRLPRGQARTPSSTQEENLSLITLRRSSRS